MHYQNATVDLKPATDLLKALCLAVALVVLVGGGAMAQANLVPNGSFEEFNYCSSFSSVGWANTWFMPEQGYDADYFNECSTYDSGLSIPQNNYGYQHPLDGLAYCGLFAFDRNHPNVRDAISVELTSALTSGEQYVFSVGLSLGDPSNYSVSTMGFLLSESSVSGMTPIYMLEPTSHCELGGLSDVVNWTIYKDTITAVGGERFLTIANFFQDGLSDTTFVGDGVTIWPIAYYYIDDVSLIPLDSLLSVHDVGKAEIVSVYPNPNNGVFTVDLPNCQGQKAAYRLSVSDVTGKTVFNSRIACGQRTLNLGNLDNGTYLLRVLSADNTERWHYKLLIMH